MKSSLLHRLYSEFSPFSKNIAAIVALSCVAASMEVVTLGILVLSATMISDGRQSDIVTLPYVHIQLSLTLSHLLQLSFVSIIGQLLSNLGTDLISSHTASRYQEQQRNRLFSLFIDAPWDKKENRQTGHITALLTTYIDRSMTLLSNFTTAMINAGTIVVLVTWSFWLRPTFAVAIFSVSVCLFFLLRPISIMSKKAAAHNALSNGIYTQNIIEAVRLAKDIEVFNVQNAIRSRVQDIVSKMEHQQFITQISGHAVPTIYRAVILTLGTLSFMVIANNHISHIETLGVIVVLMLRITSYAQSLQSSYTRILTYSEYLRRIDQDVIHYAGAKKHVGTQAIHNFDTLELRDVSFQYNSHAIALQKISLTIKRGEMIGIVGPSGAGKSTLFKMLLGLHSPQQGEVRINDTSFDTLSLGDYRHLIGYVPQEPVLLDCSVADNIRFLRNNISQQDIENAAQLAFIHDTITTLKSGYETLTGESGNTLSVGQKQRICIARALVTKPQLLFLDEPTSALDAISEDALQTVLNSMRGKLTALIIAHRIGTLKQCDRILVIEEGRVAAFDRPDIVLQNNRFFRTVAKSA